MAEIFKPILVDRTIFTLLNKRQLQPKHFEKHLNGIWLNESGKQLFIRAYEERLKETFKHDRLNKKVSYKYLVRLECYKIANYIMQTAEGYQPFVLGRRNR